MMATVSVAPGDVSHPLGDKLNQTGFLRPGNDDKQSHKKDQGGPFHLMFQHLHNIHPGKDQKEHGPGQGGHRGLHVKQCRE